MDSGVSRGVFWLPGNPPGHDFFLIGGDTVTGTDPHWPLTFAMFGKPLETNSGYATDGHNIMKDIKMNGLVDVNILDRSY